MRFLFLTTIALITVTFFAALYCSDEQVIISVEAQSPLAVGCWQSIPATTVTCGCEGLPGPGVVDTLSITWNRKRNCWIY